MISEIVDKYEQFADAVIEEFSYVLKSAPRTFEIVIRCMNRHKNYSYETIRISFIDIVSIRFLENWNQSSSVVFSAFIKVDDDTILFDFFPLIYGGGILKENNESDFQIKCRDIKYVTLQTT